MKPRSTGVLLFLVAVVALSLVVQAQNKYRLKPGAKGALCLECHESFVETTRLPHVHTPVKAGDCSDCHDPHTSTHGKLLGGDTTEICADGHGEIVPEDARSAHETAREGDCVACHDPHGSSNPDNLVRGGNELCLGCHAEMAAAVNEASYEHSPAKRDCLGCHTAHASSDSDSLLKKDEPGLCLDCHDPGQAFFGKVHLGYPVTGGRCTSCHDPHGSNNAGLFWANVHAPVASGMCKQCHQESSSPNPLQLAREGMELCRGCHNTMVNTTLSQARLHWPVVGEDSCLSCHAAHASAEGSLLREPAKPLCGQCHQDTLARQEGSVTKHEPVDDGSCTVCHSPHASDNALLLEEANLNELCGTCHDWQRHSSHPIGNEVIDPRNPNLTVDCSSCHRNHGTGLPHFVYWDHKSELCVQCHAGMQR
jgi:predicted CXXCH cytochrome family protein